MNDNDYSFKIIDNLNLEQMLKYQDMWNKLYLNNVELTPFQSFQWNFRLIKNSIYTGIAKLAIFYKKNEPIIIFPHITRREYYFFRVIDFLGAETHSDYLNFIYDSQITISDFQNFWEIISNNYKGFVFKLKQINELGKISDFMNRINLHFIRSEDECYQIPICNNEIDYIKSLEKKTRKNIKYFKNKMFKHFGESMKFSAEIYNSLKIDDINNCLDLYYNRQKVRYGKTVIDSKYDSFLRDIFKDTYKKDKIFLSVFYDDDKFYAICLGLYSPNTKKIHLMITAFDSNFKKYSLGNVLLYKTILYLYSKKNLINIEFFDLTRGNEIYKIKYGGKKHLNFDFILSKYWIITYTYDYLHNYRKKLSKIKNIFKKLKIMRI
jgi:CelD/BcsL family acetyltransferase involved in cellulose biosynthesis